MKGKMSNFNKSIKIVVVDDNLSILSEIEKLLKSKGFNNICFFNIPTDALNFIAKNKPTLIISDYSMPEMNGLEFLLKTKAFCLDAKKILHTSNVTKREELMKISSETGIEYTQKKWNRQDCAWNFDNLIASIIRFKDKNCV